MKPVKFTEQTNTHTKEGCGDLPTHIGGGQIISCWEMTLKERIKVMFSKKIWLLIMSDSQPPVCLTAEYPFSKKDIK